MRHMTIALALIAALATTCAANAKGTVRVQQADGSTQNYDGVSLRIVGKTLHITTADKKGTLVISDAACTMLDNKLLRCYPYACILKQNGQSPPITISYGTFYFNRSGDTQTLSHSSTQIPPNGVFGTLRSGHGTYVSISGTLDGGAGQ